MGKKLEKVAPDDLEKVLGELDEIMVKELGGCGSQKEAMQKEVDKARETAKTRCEKIVEDKKKAVAAFSKEGGLASEKEVTKVVEAVNRATEESKEKSKACTDFISEKGAQLKAP